MYLYFSSFSGLLTEKEHDLCRTVMAYWANFARTGWVIHLSAKSEDYHKCHFPFQCSGKESWSAVITQCKIWGFVYLAADPLMGQAWYHGPSMVMKQSIWALGWSKSLARTWRPSVTPSWRKSFQNWCALLRRRVSTMSCRCHCSFSEVLGQFLSRNYSKSSE